MELNELADIMDPHGIEVVEIDTNGMEIDPDGLYYKYRVFREPADADDHPVPMDCEYHDKNNNIRYMDEVKEFVFVLKPGTDHHARVALAAYAQSVCHEKEQLAEDLWEILRDL